MEFLLDDFSSNISKEVFGINNTVQVCDPTFFLDYSGYVELVNKSNIKYSAD